jgi:hypothetical protein
VPPLSLAADLSAAVDDYHRHGNVGTLLDIVRRLARSSSPEALALAAAPYRELPEVIIPVYESIVERAPSDAQAMVILANAYWLTGRGPDLVGDLAQGALEIDPGNRGAWHLWALAESNVRGRVDRWRQVVARFPADQLARAALADNATSLASGEHDLVALELAIATYEGLLTEADHPAHRQALETTLRTLRGWKF